MTTLTMQLRLMATLALLVTTSAVLAAQSERQERERPFKPLFVDETSMPKNSFVMAGSLHEGRGEEVGGRDEFASSDGAARSRMYTGTQVGAAYTRRGRRLTLSAEATGGARYYADLGRLVTLGHRASVGAELRLRATRLQAAHTYRDTPFQQMLPQLGANGQATRDASTPDTSLAPTHTVQQASTVGWARAFGRHSELAFNYGFNTTRSADGSTQDVHQGGSAYRHRVGRGLELRLGHQARRRQEMYDPAGGTVIVHDLDLGVDVDRELSFSRRTRVAVATGSSLLSSEAGRRFVATGEASLKHEIGRSWNAVGAYARKVDFVDGFADPFIGHTATVGLGGYWGRRFSVTLRGAVGRGAVGVDGGGTYTSASTEARGNLALRRGWSWYVEHFYYQHTVSGSLALLDGIPRGAYRRGLRTGLDIKFDAFGRRQ
jgi:hypothetical protein